MPNQYCEYKWCDSKDKKLPKFRTTKDWDTRRLHKCCYKNMKLHGYKWENVVVKNPLNVDVDVIELINSFEGAGS